MTPVERSLAALYRLTACRLACGAVARETGNLLPDDACVAALQEADAELEVLDARGGYSRTRGEHYRAPTVLA